MEVVLPAAHASIGMTSSERDEGASYSAQSLVMGEIFHAMHSVLKGSNVG